MSYESKQLLEQVKLTEDPSKEPALTVGTISMLGTGVVALVVYLFPNIPDNAVTVVLGILAVLAPLITALLTRGKVWSLHSVIEVVDEAVAQALKARAAKLAKVQGEESLKLREDTPPQTF